MDITLKGRSAVKGRTEGEALVSHKPVAFWPMVDPISGEVYQPGHDLHGKSVKEKILIYPTGCGSSYYGLYILKKGGGSPKAIVNLKFYHMQLTNALLCGIPMVYDFDRNLLDIIKNGDHVVVDGDNGTVTVTKKS